MSETTGEFDTAQGGNGGQLPVQVLSMPFYGAVLIVPGTTTMALRSLGFVCTAAGTATLTLTDGSTIAVPISVNSGAFQTLPFAVTNVALSGGASGTFWNLK